jgi:hypothetical protein
MCITLDIGDKSGGRGGRPALRFYDPMLSRGATASAHKSLYHLTLMAGCNAPGNFLPSHRQLHAQDIDGMQIPIGFIEHLLPILGMSGFREETKLSSTYGMNDKGGMNKEQFGNYMLKCFAPLWPDARDQNGKRVICLVDGGPGRTNLEMLARLCLRGVLLFPSGPPNTTHVLQVMDMLFAA